MNVEIRQAWRWLILSRTIEELVNTFFEEFPQYAQDRAVLTDELYSTFDPGTCLLAYQRERCVGLIFWAEAISKEAKAKIAVERLLYVHPDFRDQGVAESLVERWQFFAHCRGALELHSGSSLGHDAAASRTYIGCGFEPKQTFKKDLRNV